MEYREEGAEDQVVAGGPGPEPEAGVEGEGGGGEGEAEQEAEGEEVLRLERDPSQPGASARPGSAWRTL